MKTILAAISLTLLGLVSVAGAADVDPEEAAIKKVVLDYAEAWYAGDADRMEHAIQAEFVLRRATSDPKTGKNKMDQTSGLGILIATRAGLGKRVPKDSQQKEVTVLDHYGSSASAKVVMHGWVDYLHLSKWNNEWKIVNALGEVKPGPK
jgi:hypothetical protein